MRRSRDSGRDTAPADSDIPVSLPGLKRTYKRVFRVSASSGVLCIFRHQGHRPNPDDALSFFMQKRNARRIRGHIVHVGESRSAIFWAIVKGENNDVYFCYGKNFLSAQTPRVGWDCEFCPLPQAPGHKLKRATEIQILAASSPRPTTDGEIAVESLPDGRVRLVLHGRKGKKQILSELPDPLSDPREPWPEEVFD
jgi:hypothetical protein